MTPEPPDTDPENDPTALLRAKVRLQVERATVPTVGEFEGVRLMVETSSGSRFVKLVVALLVAAALVHFGPVPAPW